MPTSYGTLSFALSLAIAASACKNDDDHSSEGTDVATGASGTSTTQGFTTWEGTSSSSTSGTTTGTTTSDDDSGTPPRECGETPRAERATLIDDLENETPPRSEGRMGGWFLAHDGTSGEQFPAATYPLERTDEDAHGGDYAIRTWGSGFTDWGAEIGISFNYDGFGDCAYDVSSFAGVSFWAKGEGEIDFLVATEPTVPVSFGGTCTGTCWDDFGIVIELGDEWQHYEVRWEDLAQQGWGTRATFDPASVMWLHWSDRSAESFDIWLDDIYFLEAGGGDTDSDTDTDGSSSSSDTGDGSESTDDGSSSSESTGGEEGSSSGGSPSDDGSSSGGESTGSALPVD